MGCYNRLMTRPHPDFYSQSLKLTGKVLMPKHPFCLWKQQVIQFGANLPKDIVEGGITIGNHTYSHSNAFGFLGTQKVW